MNATAVDNTEYFKSYELQPTDDNIKDSLKNDKFGRYRYLDRFIRFLDLINYPCSIAIDGQWGSGKTFFVKQIIQILEQKNNAITPNAEQAEVISNADNLELQNTYLPIYFDAWANDNENDPLLSILHTIVTNPYIFKKESFTKQVPFLQKAATVVDALCGTGIKGIYDIKDEDNLFSSIQSMKDFTQDTHTFLTECITEKANKLVVFIDELDRCRPSYAVQLLERIKHYLSTENVIFVFSINSEELVNTVKAVYGQNFDGYRYLDRFIDFKMELPQIDIEAYLSSIGFDRYNSLFSYSVLLHILSYYNLSTREIEKCCRLVNASCGKYLRSGNHGTFSNYEPFFFGLCLPIMLAVKMTNYTLYKEFISGKNPQPLIDAVESNANIKSYLSNLASHSLAMPDSTVEEIYYSFFNLSAEAMIRKQLFETASLLSKFGSYNE